MISINKVVAGYGKQHVLNELSINLESGLIHGLVGLNGSGKSTLLRCICSLMKPISGTILLDEVTVSKRNISLLETEPYFYSGITGREYLWLFKSKAESKFDATAWQELFNIPLDKLIDNYSTGMKKKLAILGMLKTNNQVLLFDEPFNGLDIESSRIFSSVLKKLIASDKTIIITSHVLESLTAICDKIHYLKDGVINQTFDSMNAELIDKALFHELDLQVAKSINQLL
ncbi:MAG: ATP-binding cassette domain-containing protein [Bacteroidetes bacterium]|nr:ATP-binding cassette domain-containing protein [Bacteroidota bacterium]